MGLRIRQQFGQIGLKIKSPFLNIETTPRRFELKTSLPKTSINKKQEPIKIDQKEFFASLCYRNLQQFAQHLASIAKNAILEGIGQRAAEGDMLGAIEKNISIADVARMNAARFFESDLVLPGPAPGPAVEVSQIPVEIEVEPGRLDVNYVRGDVRVKLDRGQVNVYLDKPPYIKMADVGKVIDTVV